MTRNANAIIVQREGDLKLSELIQLLIEALNECGDHPVYMARDRHGEAIRLKLDIDIHRDNVVTLWEW